MNAAFWIRIFFAVCLAGATYNHIVPLLQDGWRAYGGMPAGIRLYWCSLTLFDPLAAILLFLKPRTGLLLLLLIMFSDVGINAAVVIVYGGFDARFLEQALFLAMVLATMPIMWRAPVPVSGQ